jgi:nucleoside-diphosphate-sugar epimerase
MKEKFLVIGAFGQVGNELVPTLQKYFGKESVVAVDNRKIKPDFEAKIEIASVLNKKAILKLVEKYKINFIINLASLLSVKSEMVPEKAFSINLLGLKNTLDIARDKKLKIFWPSSIAVFGPTTPKENTPQETIITPTTMYGITKRAGELLCQYYYLKWKVDVRSLRYPGLLDWKTEPSTGTTEYVKHMFYEGIRKNFYQCPLKPDTKLPMMYIKDAILATIKLIKAKSEKIKVRTSYNLASFSFSPNDLYQELKKYLPNFKIEYKINPQIQRIADSWPRSIDDERAKKDFGWKPKYSFEETVKIMYENIKKKLKNNAN